MPDPTRADEPAPVPPPVDAPLCFEHDFSVVAEHTEGDVTVCLGCGERGDEAEPAWLDRVASAAAVYGHPATSEGAYDQLVTEVRALWAAGVEEGRRQLDAEIHTNVFTSARTVAAEAGFGPVPESITVSYERRASAYEQEIYDAGVAEGRRHLQVLLDHAEQYARDLQDNGDVPERIEEKIDRIREWLRMHGDYDVELSLWAPYGTIRVKLTHLNGTVWSDFGTTLGKRLDWALAQIEKLGEATHG